MKPLNIKVEEEDFTALVDKCNELDLTCNSAIRIIEQFIKTFV